MAKTTVSRLTRVGVLLALVAPAWGQEALLWGSLKPGPHPVGYSSHYEFDQTRQYDPEFSSDAAEPKPLRPRPILVCAWYPAKAMGQPMQYRQYLDVSADDPRLATFVRRVTYNVYSVVGEETVGKLPAKFTPAEAAAFDRLLDTKTFAAKDAPPAEGRFPLVIYHPGLSGTHEDNSALFEFLASHGFVVLSSTYHAPDAYSVKCGGHLACSFRDMEFLVRYGRGLPFADADRLGAMGHSYGGWAILAWAAEPDSALRAFVTLDSGLEYDTVETSGAEALQYQLKVNKESIRAASMRCAARDRKPHFEHLDPYLKFAPRYEVSLAALTHNDFLTHGAMRPALLPEKWPDAARRASYDRMCEHILHFFEMTLKNQSGARESLERSLRGAGGDNGCQVSFKPAAPLVPTNWQLAQYVQKHGAEKTADLARSCFGSADALYGAAFVLLQEGDARAAFAALKVAEKECSEKAGFQAMLGQALALTNDRPAALAAFRRAAELLAKEDTTGGMPRYWKFVVDQGLRELGEAEAAKGP